MNAIDIKRITLEEAKRIEREAKQKASALKIRYAAYMIATVLGTQDHTYAGYRVQRWVYQGIRAGRTWLITANEGLDKTIRVEVDGLLVLDSFRLGSYQTFRDGDWLPEFGTLFEEARRRNATKAMHAERDEVTRMLLNFAPTSA
jgi:hypothetical protein